MIILNKENVVYSLVCILIGVLVTHGTRSVPIMLIKGKIKNQFVRSLLDYIPFAVISFLTFPSVFDIQGMSKIPTICGFLTAVFLAYKGKNLLIVAMGATLVSLILMLVCPHLGGVFTV